MDKIFFMNEAINEAKKAYDKGETPIGAGYGTNGKRFGIGWSERSIFTSF